MALKQYKLNLEEDYVFLLDRFLVRKDKNAQKVSRSEWIRNLMKNELIREGVISDE